MRRGMAILVRGNPLSCDFWHLASQRPPAAGSPRHRNRPGPPLWLRAFVIRKAKSLAFRHFADHSSPHRKGRDRRTPSSPRPLLCVWPLISLVVRQAHHEGKGKRGAGSVPLLVWYVARKPRPAGVLAPSGVFTLALAFAPRSAAREFLDGLRFSGSPPIKRRRRGHHMGPELGAHRPAALSMRCRSGTDRCPDARSAHPFPVQRYLREGG